MAALAERITVNPEQCGGRPCVRGLRIRVTDVLDLLASGLHRNRCSRGCRIWNQATCLRVCASLAGVLIIPSSPRDALARQSSSTGARRVDACHDLHRMPSCT
jgi:hypothetical protein